VRLFSWTELVQTAIWAAINEPRGEQLLVIEELLKAGARLEHDEYPTGHEHVDAVLKCSSSDLI
jgi:hypothetical protein